MFIADNRHLFCECFAHVNSNYKRIKRTMFCSLIKIALAGKVRNKTLWNVTLEKTIINNK